MRLTVMVILIALVGFPAFAGDENPVQVIQKYSSTKITNSSKTTKVTKKSDVECMAQAIYHEAGGESKIGKVAVGKVVINRIKSGFYPKDVCSVVYQRNYKAAGCQFTWACRKNVREVRKYVWEESVLIAQGVLAGEFKDPTHGATSFNNRPFKNKGLKQTVKIGNHYFYQNRRVASIN